MMTVSAGKKWPKTWKKGWRKKYRVGWHKCECGIQWQYLGVVGYKGKMVKAWERYWPGVSLSVLVYSDEEMQYNDGDCWGYLRRHSND